jgi:hypothetical protein
MGRIKAYWGQLLRGHDGRRFRELYAYRHRRRGDGPWARTLTILAGVGLVFGGLAIGWLPGPGGFIALIGGALLAAEFLPIAKALDWAERRIRAIVHRLRNATSS